MPRSTTDKYDVRRALVLERLIRAWDKRPSMRLGCLVVEALEMSTPFDVLVLRGIDDMDLVEKLERYVLMEHSPSSTPTEEPPGSDPGTGEFSP